MLFSLSVVFDSLQPHGLQHTRLLCPSLSPKFAQTPVPLWLSGKQSAYNAGAAGDVSLITGLGRFPGGGNGNPLQYSYLEDPMDRGAWWTIAHRSWT